MFACFAIDMALSTCKSWVSRTWCLRPGAISESFSLSLFEWEAKGTSQGHPGTSISCLLISFVNKTGNMQIWWVFVFARGGGVGGVEVKGTFSFV